jgi:hypothetical protein
VNHYALVPEVAGHFGADTIFLDEVARPPLIEKLHYEFDGWLGDPIIETICCYIVTDSLRDKILALDPSGVKFGDVRVSKSREFVERNPGRSLPGFTWLQITGVAGKDDFGYTTTHGHYIVVSSRVLDLLWESGMQHCSVVELRNWKGGKEAILESIRQFKLKHPLPILK